MSKTIKSQTGIKMFVSDRFCEQYDRALDIRKCGDDNLYFQHINDYFSSSPTFNKCVERKKMMMYGEGSNSKLITNKIFSAIMADYAKFNGFALHITYNGLGDVVAVNYVPFETIRLGEQGTNGLYTYCYYCSDWSGVKTINSKKVEPKTNKVKYWMYTDNLETRLSRIEAANGCYVGEILYFSNTISYPVSPINAIIGYVSAEVGLQNITYRDVRANFLPSSVLAVPKQSEEDFNALSNNLVELQSDFNAYKVLMIEHSTPDDKPEVLNLQGDDYMNRYQSVITDCTDKILGAYGQEAFKRLLDGALGFGSDTIAEIYKYYNWSLKAERSEITSFLAQIDPTFKIKELVYESSNANKQVEI